MYTASGKSDKNSILTEHAPLVKRLAYQLKARLPPSVEVDDLVQAGMIGLLDAVNRYEDNHGAQFETYAIQRIRGAMLDELRQMDHLGRGQRRKIKALQIARERWRGAHGIEAHTPTGQVADRGSGGEPGRKQQIEQLPVIER